jgi:hypothetical protein
MNLVAGNRWVQYRSRAKIPNRRSIGDRILVNLIIDFPIERASVSYFKLEALFY